jgi:cytosine deaminase
VRLCGKGAMLWPAFVDVHTHLCKTHAVPRCRNPSGSINDALACEVADQPRWFAGCEAGAYTRPLFGST